MHPASHRFHLVLVPQFIILKPQQAVVKLPRLRLNHNFGNNLLPQSIPPIRVNFQDRLESPVGEVNRAVARIWLAAQPPCELLEIWPANVREFEAAFRPVPIYPYSRDLRAMATARSLQPSSF
jgi:hypothetical protein